MSKRGRYIGGRTVWHANPKGLDDVVVNSFDTQKRDVIAEIRKEKRDARAELAAQPNPNNFSPTVAWSADTGLIQAGYQHKRKSVG